MSGTTAAGREDIPQGLLQARLATTAQLLELNQRANERRWAAFDPQRFAFRLDPVDRHCVFPMLRIGGKDASAGCRCYLWFKERGRNSRTLVLMDVSDEDLQLLPVIPEPYLHRLVGMLLGELPLVLLTENEESSELP
jgi:hypothetical protein